MLSFDPATNDYSAIKGMNPFKSIAIPRPIGWISTVSPDGVHNLAPYSQFGNVGFDPPYVMFCAQPNNELARKHSVINAENSRCFVHNLVTYDLAQKMLITAKDSGPEVDEFAEAGLTKLASVKVSAMRVAESPIQLECEYVTTIRLPGTTPSGHSDLVIGKVVMIHIDENYVTTEGKLDVLKLRPLSRLGYSDFTSIVENFTLRVANMAEKPVPGSYTWMSPTGK